jgi:hypothetical protein
VGEGRTKIVESVLRVDIVGKVFEELCVREKEEKNDVSLGKALIPCLDSREANLFSVFCLTNWLR